MSERRIGKKAIIADVILAAALLIVALSVFLVVRLSQSEGTYAVVSVDGERVATYSLAVDGEYDIGGTNTLVIKEGEAYIVYASCPDGLCINQGKKSRVGERIVCLPNRVMVEIVGDDEEMLEI